MVVGGFRLQNKNLACYVGFMAFLLYFRFGNLQPLQFSSVQSLSHIRLFATPWIAAHQASLSITNSWSFYSNPCPLSQWCHQAISSSVVPFSSCPQSFPASGSFPKSQLFVWGGWSTGVSAQHQSFQWTLRPHLLSNGLVGSPCSPRDFQESSPTPQFKSINSSAFSFLHSPTLTSIYDYQENHRWTFVGKVMSLLFNILSRLVIVFLPRSKHLLISRLQSPSAVIL